MMMKLGTFHSMLLAVLVATPAVSSADVAVQPRAYPKLATTTVAMPKAVLANRPVQGAGVNSSARTNLAKPAVTEPTRQWSAALGYTLGSDWANEELPKANHSVKGTFGYQVTDKVDVGVEATLGATTVKNQIWKDASQSHEEVVNPSMTFSTGYADAINADHGYDLGAHLQLPFDESSRREGYRAILGASTGATLTFFGKRLSISPSVDYSYLVNTYRQSLSGKANPDSFLTLSLDGGVKLYKGFSLGLSIGFKMTHYLDDFYGNGAQSGISLAHKWKNVSASVGYQFGQFTNETDYAKWFIDEYRRIARFGLKYTF